MPTANEELRDAIVRHQIGLMRLSGSIRNRVLALLDRTEDDLKSIIKSRLGAIAGREGLDFGPTVTARLKALEKVIASTRGKAFVAVEALLTEEMVELAKMEGQDFLPRAVKAALPTVFDPLSPSTTLLAAIVRTHPLQGRLLVEWARTLAAADRARIMDQIKVGLVQGEPVEQISRRIVGTASLRGTNGVTEISRRQAAAIVRTSVNAITNRAKQLFFLANKDVIRKELYVATLDSRTTLICSSLDGKTFEVGAGPRPPLHVNCRSTRVGVVGDAVVGNRPLKASTERGLLREFAEREGLKPVTARSKLPYGLKGKFDDFARRRVRELIGSVPAAQTYQEFLRNQPKAFQEDVLGVTKAKLFRDGGLSLDKFVDRAGNELTLDELRRREAAAFEAAGLGGG